MSPKPARNLALGALLGALVGWGIAVSGRRRPSPPVEQAEQRQLPITPPVPAPAPVLEPVPAPVQEPEPVPAGPFVPPRLGEWTVDDVERLLAEQEHAFPERAEELHVYLESFRGVAGADGRLPGGVEGVMEDVFRELIERARRAE